MNAVAAYRHVQQVMPQRCFRLGVEIWHIFHEQDQSHAVTVDHKIYIEGLGEFCGLSWTSAIARFDEAFGSARAKPDPTALRKLEQFGESASVLPAAQQWEGTR